MRAVKVICVTQVRDSEFSFKLIYVGKKNLQRHPQMMSFMLSLQVMRFDYLTFYSAYLLKQR